MEQEQMKLFQSGKVSIAVLKNAIPAMIAMLMVLIYYLADTFFIGQTHDDLQVAAVSMCTPVFCSFWRQAPFLGWAGFLSFPARWVREKRWPSAFRLLWPSS